MMNELNEIWKEHTGNDLTEKEAWQMVDLVEFMCECMDKKIDEELQK